MKFIKKIAKNLPIVKDLVDQRNSLNKELNELKSLQFRNPGHFYSPIPSEEDIKETVNNFNYNEEISAVNLNKDEQFQFLKSLKAIYNEIPFKDKKMEQYRYYFDNIPYTYSDAVFYYCMIRKLQPKKIIEVGSGFSSCIMLDTNEIYFNNQISMTCIEPYPELLYSLIKEDDKKRIVVRKDKLQNIELSLFESLEENDILFIDSTHISKINSDVNYLFFKILPALKKGVYIHIHDIFYPFEYPIEWVKENRAYNELYLLRSFLQYNTEFKIVLFNTYLEHIYPEYFHENMPLCMKNIGGSIWLKKV